MTACANLGSPVGGAHADEGPNDRYRVPYQPITYGQPTPAPLPGLAIDYKFVDWDDDGRTDLLATVRRGKGLVWYRNVGTPQRPHFRSLEENEVLLPADQVGDYFDIIDYDGDGQRDLVVFEAQSQTGLVDNSGKLMLYRQGGPGGAQWEGLIARSPTGDPITAAAESWSSYRVSAADWDGDGRTDLIVGYEDIYALVPDSEVRNKRNRVQGFKPISAYRTQVGRIGWFKNLSQTGGPPVFAPEQPVFADGEAIATYIFPYPLVYDLDQDGRMDLVIGSHNTELQFYRNTAAEGEPVLQYQGLLADESGTPLRTFLSIRVQPADLNGDGEDELISSSYYGNNDRYLVYQRVGKEALRWRYTDYLKISADKNTPVYGMGISTIDPIDWDGDGDIDLLLGAEGSFPAVVINSGTEADRKFEAAQLLKQPDGEPLETFSIEQGEGSYWGPLEWYSDRIAPRGVDWDGDGVLDLISGSMGRRLYFFKGRRVHGELRFEPPRNFQFGGEELALPDRVFPGITDWNMDTLPDLMLSTDPGHVVVYPGNRTLDLAPPDTLRHSSGEFIILQDFWERKKGNRSGFTVADWDADGDRDLIIYQFHRGVFLFRNAGDDTFGREELLVPLYSHLAGPSVYDWDDDGFIDLLIGGDERRMIESMRPAHLVVYRGQDTDLPPTSQKR